MGAPGDESAMNLEGVATQLSLAFLEDTQRSRMLLSQPRQPTPIATTALPGPRGGAGESWWDTANRATYGRRYANP